MSQHVSRMGMGGITRVLALVAVAAVVVLAATVAFAWASRLPLRNLLSSSQRMNARHNPLHLAGSYGAFGSVTRQRYELVVEGSDDGGRTWRPYTFRAKPQDPHRRPPQVAPFHLRTDWLLWFAAMSPRPTRRDVWLRRFVQRLLTDDPLVRRLLRDDPFDGAPPSSVRVRRVRYRFATDEERSVDGRTWTTGASTTWLGPVGRTD